MDSSPQKRRGDPVVGARIRTIRKDRGLTLRQLAGTAKIDFHNLSKLENGRVGYSPESIRRIAEALQVPISHIFMETEPAVTGNAVFWIPWVDDPTKSPLPIEHDYGEHTTALRMPDDSMAPEIPEGATVIMKRARLCRPGRLFGIRMVEEGEITHTVRRIKEVSRDPNDSRELKDGISFPRRKEFEVVPTSEYYKSECVLENHILGEVVELRYKLR